MIRRLRDLSTFTIQVNLSGVKDYESISIEGPSDNSENYLQWDFLCFRASDLLEYSQTLLFLQETTILFPQSYADVDYLNL